LPNELGLNAIPFNETELPRGGSLLEIMVATRSASSASIFSRTNKVNDDASGFTSSKEESVTARHELNAQDEIDVREIAAAAMYAISRTSDGRIVDQTKAMDALIVALASIIAQDERFGSRQAVAKVCQVISNALGRCVADMRHSRVH
jgi:hypothetical protein